MLSIPPLSPSGLRPLRDFDGARAAPSPQDRLREVRRRAQALRERMLGEPEVLCWRRFDLIRAPYPTCHAYSGVFADRGFKFPLEHLLNRLFVVQCLDHGGVLRTLLMSPSDHSANRETPFFKHLAERGPQWLQPQDIDHISYDHLHTQDLSLGPGVALVHNPGHTEGNHSLATGKEVILNGNTLEGSTDQYISMVLEKTLAGPSANPDFPNCATSSERTPYWLFPGEPASHLFGEAHFGHIRRPGAAPVLRAA